ncbi:MAG TPA: AMP-binding protein, partial [Sediminibacterium sp.]|nr:AMP-binding protein [Sediminibacterium sp.]
MMAEAIKPIFLKDPAESNRTAADYPKIALHALIEQTAARCSDKQAVRFEQQGISYRELNERANRLSHWLMAKGVQPGSIIGLLISRSESLPVVLLAILKTGAAYIPLDPDYPGERIQYMLENAQ